LIKFFVSSGHEVSTLVGRELRDIKLRYATCTDLPVLVFSRFKRNPIKHIFDIILSMKIFFFYLKPKFGDFDLVYCNTVGTLPCALIAKFFGFKVVLHLHETASNRSVAFVLRHLMNYLDFIICVSNVVKESWSLSGDKIFVVHNGIDKVSVCEFKSKDYDICFVGRLIDKKGIRFFLRSLEAISLTNQRSLKVLIAGGFVRDSSASVKIPTSLNGRIFVDYLGEVEDTSNVFSRSKVACVPSLFKDPFPTTVLEGLRAGCTVVATNNGGAAEALKGLSTSYLVPTNDVDELADALIRATSEFTELIFRENIKFFNDNLSLRKFQSEFTGLPFL